MKKSMIILLPLLFLICAGMIRAALNNKTADEYGSAVPGTAFAVSDKDSFVPAVVDEEAYRLKNYSFAQKPDENGVDLIRLDDNRVIRLYVSETPNNIDVAYTLEYKFVVCDKTAESEKVIFKKEERFIGMRPVHIPVVLDAVADDSLTSFKYILYAGDPGVSLIDVNLQKISNFSGTAQYNEVELVYNAKHRYHKQNPEDRFFFITPSVIDMCWSGEQEWQSKIGAFRRYTMSDKQLADNRESEKKHAKEMGISDYKSDFDSPVGYRYRLPSIIWGNTEWNEKRPRNITTSNAVFTDPDLKVSDIRPEYDMSEWEGWHKLERTANN